MVQQSSDMTQTISSWSKRKEFSERSLKLPATVLSPLGAKIGMLATIIPIIGHERSRQQDTIYLGENQKKCKNINSEFLYFSFKELSI